MPKVRTSLILCYGLFLAQPLLQAETNTFAETVVNKIRAEFEALRMNEKDFKLSPGWDLPFTISSVENFFSNPLDIPTSASTWSDAVETATKKVELFEVARKILASTTSVSHPVLKETAVIPVHVPPSIRAPIKILGHALQKAQPLLTRAVDAVAPTSRSGFLSLNEWPDPDTGAIQQEISAQRTKARYEGMKPFPQNDILAAGTIVFEALDRALALLAEIPLTPTLSPQGRGSMERIRWRTPQGVFLVSGSGDDVYDQDDLKDVAVLIDLGGKNTYKVPVATAHEKEIRLVIDLGSDVTIEGKDDIRGNAGCGVFGIGILVLPNAQGIKELHTGPFSQGVGVGGIGALFISGPAHLTADRNVQGTGIFGVGILSAQDGTASTYSAVRSGQGAAFTRGVGIFIHQGDNADIKGGLVQPDPREPLGSVSLCQGVGFGPRAYAGGGVGLAVVKGNGISVQGSYFSQGVGYWHGMGVFRLRGDRCTLQARRYTMGSGVHSAFGHFDVYGNFNRILNWGVGPSYGWDHSIGSSLIEGDDNEMQTEWGANTASIGSLSFSYYRLNQSKLKLCDYGSNNFFRDEPAYSIQILDGQDNRLQCQGSAETSGAHLRRLRSPWGLFHIQGTLLDENLKLMPPVWPDLPRGEAIQRDMVDLQARLEEAPKKSSLEEVADLVDVASAFSLDKVSPRVALQKLLTLPPEKVPFLIDVLEPAAIDQLIQLCIAIPAHGEAITHVMLRRIEDVDFQKKSTLINLLRMGRPSSVCPALFEMLKNPANERLKGAILRTLGQMLNQDTGEEPGTRVALSALASQLSKPTNQAQRDKTLALLKQLQFAQSFGLLASACDLDSQTREKFFDAAPQDLSAILQIEGAKTFLNIMHASREKNLAILNRELSALESAEPLARKFAAEMLTSTRPAIVAAALVALGQIAHPDDAVLMESALTHESTPVREAAAVALGRMGEAALPIFSRVMKTNNPRSRALVMAGISQAVSAKVLPILEMGLIDTDPGVRLTALAVAERPSSALQPRRSKLLAYARKKLVNEKDPNVKLALELLK